METLSIEIINSKAINLLRDMEDLKIIRILNNNKAKNKKLAEYFKGSNSKEAAVEMNDYVKKSREEWERNF